MFLYFWVPFLLCLDLFIQKIKRHIIAFILCCCSLNSFWSTALYASDTSLTLFDVYRLAMSHDPSLASARNQFKVTLEEVPKARASLMPQSNLSYTPTRQAGYYEPDPSTAVKSASLQTQYTIQNSQTLFDLTGWYSLKKAHALVDAGSKDLRVAEQNAMVKVTSAFFDVLTAQETLNLINAQINSYSALLSQIQTGYEKGEYTVTETNEAQVKLQLARAKKIEALGDIDIKKAQLESLIGPLRGRSLAALKADVNPPAPQPNNIDFWSQRAFTLSPSVLSELAKVRAAELDVTASKGSYYPKVQLSVNFNKQFNSYVLSSPGNSPYGLNYAEIALQVSVPLFSGGAISSRIRESLALKQKEQSELDLARIQSQTSARQYYIESTTHLAEIKAYRLAVISAEKTVDGNAAGLKLGTKLIVDLLNARENLFQARVNYIIAKHNAFVSILKLKASIGDLGLSDFQAFNYYLNAHS